MFIRFVRPGIFDTRLSKIGNALNDPRLTLNAWLSKLHCINWILTPDAQILIHFAVQSGLTYRYKVAENHREMAVRDPCEWLLGQPPLNWLTNQSQKWLLQLPPCGYFPNQTSTSWKSYGVEIELIVALRAASSRSWISMLFRPLTSVCNLWNFDFKIKAQFQPLR